MPSDMTPISLSEFQQRLINAIRMAPDTQHQWVAAELSDVGFRGGHCYMELVEKDASGGTRAKMRATIWASTLLPLRRKFYEATGRDIASGIKVLVRGSASHHAVYGLSMNITDIDPSYTLGDMERQRREILARLTVEGIIGYNRSLSLPPVLQRIAVVSAEGAAGYGDFINQLASNAEGFQVYPMLFRAVMQGDRTVPTVMDCLDRVESTLDFWDCVVIIRGGGATTDLNAFDNYDLARRVATFPIPVVVGIGHERDRTVLDEIACVRCKTPTAVAAFIIDRMRDFYGRVCDMVQRVARYDRDALRGEHIRLSGMETAIPTLARKSLLTARMRLQKAGAGIERGVTQRFTRERGRLDNLVLRMQSAAARRMERQRFRLEKIESMVRVLSPVNTLNRGYSITRIDGKALRDPSALAEGTVIETELAEGTITSKITRTNGR